MMLVFLKLGGSLITKKDQPYTARIDVIKRAAEEISKAMAEDSKLKIILGHGSGSFGHFAAKESGFKEGEPFTSQSQAFQKIWFAANELNQIVVKEFNESGLPVVSFPPSASISTNNKEIVEWNIEPIKSALNNTLIPVVFGDTVFDHSLGGIILSTEELFNYLIDQLNPGRILLVGKEKGIWADFPVNKNLIPKVTPENDARINTNIVSSTAIDVTGGMQKKVALMLKAIEIDSNLIIEIFSGEVPGSIYKSLKGIRTGTSISVK
jgi:isopentenyl phosphate kinase